MEDDSTCLSSGSKSIEQGWLRSLSQPLVKLDEEMPRSLLDKYKLMSRCQAVRYAFPEDLAGHKQALRPESS